MQSDQGLGSFDDDDDECNDDPTVAILAETTILIFDWDDTVLPSTWIQEQGLRLDDESSPTIEQQVLLEKLAESVAQTLRVAKRHGRVTLVTNAEHGWIELSCQKFLPTLYPFLQNVKILSARSTYEQQGVASPFEWKYLAFENEISGFYRSVGMDRLKNVISFGDSAHEREALIRATEHMENCRTKSLKFVERPEVQQLLKQHELINVCFPHIVNHDGNLDLCIRCS